VEGCAVRRKPFAILRYLVGNPRRLVTHEELLEHVWSGAVVSESAVRTHLHELRQLLGEGVIETVIGRGYRFTAELAHAAAAAPVAAAPAPVIFGRDQELAVLRGALERASGGHRQLCFVTGDPGTDRAIADAQGALVLARETGDPFALGLGHCNLARLAIMRGDSIASVRGLAEQVLAMPLSFMWHSAAQLLVMWSDAQGAPLEDAQAQQIVDAFHERVRLFPVGSSHYALPALDALRRGGQHARALALVRDVLAMVRPRGERILESELVRMQGELIEPADPAAALAAYREAVAIAHELGALSLELRAAIRLATIDPSALELVRSLHARFEEGLETGDLVAARTLLATSSP
jgi:hypothetical protein